MPQPLLRLRTDKFRPVSDRAETMTVSNRQRVGFVNSGGLVFVDESAEEIPTL
jgi:hypothetical protein